MGWNVTVVADSKEKVVAAVAAEGMPEPHRAALRAAVEAAPDGRATYSLTGSGHASDDRSAQYLRIALNTSPGADQPGGPDGDDHPAY